MTTARFPVLLAALIGTVTILVLLTVLCLKKRRNRTGRTRAVGVPLRLEVLQGSVTSKKRVLKVSDSLFIGGDKRCDVWLPHSAPLHSRVFLRNGTLFIEDLNSPNGTILGGMRIHTPNPLKSGDRITIDESCFAFYFQSTCPDP